MDGRRVAPLVGIAGCLGVLAALAYPYLVSDGVGAYYGSGMVNPLVAGLLALLGIIVFAAGREGRSDPVFAAGAALVFGLAVLLLLLGWGLTARVDAVTVEGAHRWIVTGLAFPAPVAAAWYARALGLF
ncbi:MAG: hypothetical protein ABEH56_02590 [Salinirussus sp.]